MPRRRAPDGHNPRQVNSPWRPRIPAASQQPARPDPAGLNPADAQERTFNPQPPGYTDDHSRSGLVLTTLRGRQPRKVAQTAAGLSGGRCVCDDRRRAKDRLAGWLAGTVGLDQAGFIVTGHDAPRHPDFARHRRGAGRAPFLLETTQPGVFAVGDVRSGSTKRVAAAVGDGALVVRSIHDARAFTGQQQRASRATKAK
jgi:hypothetical protein